MNAPVRTIDLVGATTLPIEGMTCASCVGRIERALQAVPGPARPRRGRFWVPLIALFSGMRMNEICQLHAADIHRLDGVDCFFVTEGPSDSDNGKRLKTAASERLIPIHPALIEMGFMTFVTERRATGAVRLFSELQKSSTGLGPDDRPL